MRRIRLFHLTVAVWIALLALVVTYRHELAWAVRALPAQIGHGDYPDQTQWRLYADADEAWSSRQDATGAIAMLERSLAIEPNADPMFLLAEIRESRGEEAEALALYLRIAEFDATYVEAYLRAADLHEKQGDRDKSLVLLRKGLDYFRRETERFQPVFDLSVPGEANVQAKRTYDAYVEGSRLLQAEVDRRDAGPGAPPWGRP